MESREYGEAEEHKMERLEVAIVSASLSTGGAERFAATLASHLDRESFESTLYLLRDDIAYQIPAGIEIKVLGKERPRHIGRAVGRLRALVEEEKPALVLSNIAFTNLVTGLALRKSRYRPRWIARVGVNPIHWEERYLRPLYRWCYRRVDHNVVISSQLRSEFRRIYEIPGDRVQTIYNATDFERIDHLAADDSVHEEKRGRPVVIVVGRLERQKRPDLYLEAFARVRAFQDAELWICGEGSLRGWVEEKVRSLGLESTVRILGFCHNPYALMRQATLFLLTSDYEGLCYSLVEAQGLGVPAVATRCPYGPDEVVEHGVTGLLTEVGNVDECAEAMIEILGDRDRQIEMGRLAKERARRIFDARSIVPQWEALFRSLAGQDPTRAT